MRRQASRRPSPEKRPAVSSTPAGLSQRTSPVRPGQTTVLKVTLAKTGQYELYCPVDGHKNLGMRASVALGSGGAQGSTTTTPTATTTTGTTTGGTGYGGY